MAIAPRALISSGESADKIRQRLDLAVRDLSNHADEAGRPEVAVSSTCQVIEDLTRRLWPDRFEMGSSPDLPAMWRNLFLCPPTELEGRFGSIATTLHFTYRNPASHRVDDFKCSAIEAFFFIQGLRTLVDLWERIKKERDTDE